MEGQIEPTELTEETEIALLVSLIILLVGIMVSPAACPSEASAQSTCGEDQICVQRDRAERFVEDAETVQCLDNQSVEIVPSEDSTYRIIVDDDGRAYTKGELKLTLRWCGYTAEVSHRPDIKVHRKYEDESDFGIRFRPRLGAVWRPLPYDHGSYTQPDSLFGPALLVESFYWRFLHAEAHIGLKTFGAGVGVDLTSNMDAYGGAGLYWRDLSDVTPVVGLSLAFF